MMENKKIKVIALIAILLSIYLFGCRDDFYKLLGKKSDYDVGKVININ